jgi:hypothetical protein
MFNKRGPLLHQISQQQRQQQQQGSSSVGTTSAASARGGNDNNNNNNAARLGKISGTRRTREQMNLHPTRLLHDRHMLLMQQDAEDGAVAAMPSGGGAATHTTTGSMMPRSDANKRFPHALPQHHDDADDDEVSFPDDADQVKNKNIDNDGSSFDVDDNDEVEDDDDEDATMLGVLNGSTVLQRAFAHEIVQLSTRKQTAAPAAASGARALNSSSFGPASSSRFHSKPLSFDDDDEDDNGGCEFGSVLSFAHRRPSVPPPTPVLSPSFSCSSSAAATAGPAAAGEPFHNSHPHQQQQRHEPRFGFWSLPSSSSSSSSNLHHFASKPALSSSSGGHNVNINGNVNGCSIRNGGGGAAAASNATAADHRRVFNAMCWQPDTRSSSFHQQLQNW